MFTRLRNGLWETYSDCPTMIETFVGVILAIYGLAFFFSSLILGSIGLLLTVIFGVICYTHPEVIDSQHSGADGL